MFQFLWFSKSSNHSNFKVKLELNFKSKTFLRFLTIAIVLGVGIYFRGYSTERNIQQKNRQVARLLVMNHLRNQAEKMVTENKPDLSSEKKDLAVEEQLENLKRTEHLQIRQNINLIAQKDGPFKFYLLGSDPFYYYDLTKRLIKDGRISEHYRDGQYFDPMMKAPTGFWRQIELHAFTGYITYLIMNIFSDTTPMEACVWPIVVLYMLTAGLFTKWLMNLNTSRHIALVTGVFFSLTPIFLQRSMAGWYDTDVYVILFPLLALMGLKKFLRKDKTSAGVLHLICTCAFFSLFWEGWIFLTLFLHSTLGALMIRRKVRKKSLSPLIKKSALYSLGTFALSALLITPSGVLRSFNNILEIVQDFLMLQFNIWPNLLVMVHELRPVELVKSIHLLGGHLFVLAAIAGFSVILFHGFFKKNRETDIAFAVIFAFFFLFSFSAERFLLFLVLPASFCFAAGYQKALELAQHKWRENGYIAIITIFYLTLGFAFFYGHKTASTQLPRFNRVWENALIEIRENTPKNTIINSWWPPGHFIKAIGERRVFTDGATIQTPRAYWKAKALMNEEEKHALRILRMLNSSGIDSVDYLKEEGLATIDAVRLIEKIVIIPRKEALEKAHEYLGPDQAEKLIELTHGQAPPSYLFLYKDLVEGSLGLYFVNNWSLERMNQHIERQKEAPLPKKVLSRGKGKDTIQFLWSIAGGRPYIGEETYPHSIQNNNAFFPNGVTIDLKNMTARIDNLEGFVTGIPKSMFFVRHGRLEEKLFARGTLNLSVLLLEDNSGQISSITAPRELLNSVMFRLYYFNGLGMRHFDKVYSEGSPILDNKIKIFKIRWENEN